MNDICATVGLENIKHINKILTANRKNALHYDRELKNNPKIQLLKINNTVKSSNWLYTFKVEDQEKFMDKMKKCGIVVSRVHERNDKHSCVKNFTTILPNLDSLTQQMICIPAGWWLTQDDITRIIKCINDGWL